MALRINGPQAGELSEAIESAIDSPMMLQQVIRYKLDANIFDFCGFGASYPEIRYNMVREYNSRYQIDKLVIALLEHNPTNERLLKFAWDHRIVQAHRVPSDTVPAAEPLERMLDPERGFSDPMQFLRRFAQITQCVCRIAVPVSAGIEYGTGLLVGNSTVLTNYHVLQSLIEKKAGADRKRVEFMFDYHTDADGQTISPGVIHRLIDDDQRWLIDSSPYDSADAVLRTLGDNLQIARPSDHLDYAVVRLADAPGSKPIGERPSEFGAKRGSIPLPRDAAGRFDADFELKTSAMFVFQHPSKLPLRMDWQKPAILGVNVNRTRVLYDVNTQHGSSGAPCFNSRLELTALHHAGGKDWPASMELLYNQGIPICAIYDLLQQRGKLSEIQ